MLESVGAAIAGLDGAAAEPAADADADALPGWTSQLPPPEEGGAPAAAAEAADVQVRGMLTKQALSFPWNWKERYFVYSAASGALRYYEPSSAPVSKARTEGAVPSVAAELRGTVQPLTAVLPLGHEPLGVLFIGGGADGAEKVELRVRAPTVAARAEWLALGADIATPPPVAKDAQAVLPRRRRCCTRGRPTTARRSLGAARRRRRSSTSRSPASGSSALRAVGGAAEGRRLRMRCLDTAMVGRDGEDDATVVVQEHEYATDLVAPNGAASGLPLGHAWMRLRLRRDVGGGWRLRKWERARVWRSAKFLKPKMSSFEYNDEPLVPVGNHSCPYGLVGADVPSVAAAAVAALGGSSRADFAAVATDDVSVRVPALGVAADGVAEAWAARGALVPSGSSSLCSIDSLMLTSTGATTAQALAYLRAYHVKEDDFRPGSGVCIAHIALKLDFTLQRDNRLEKPSLRPSWKLAKYFGDVVWWTRPERCPTEGVGFDGPCGAELASCALIVLKAWEMEDADTFEALVDPKVILEVPRHSVKEHGRRAVWEYRESLGRVGLLAIDTIAVEPTKNGGTFSAYLHEYAAHAGGSGLPTQHAGVKLEFALGRGGAYSLVRFFLDVEWRHRRRASFSGAADARAAVLSSQI